MKLKIEPREMYSCSVFVAGRDRCQHLYWRVGWLPHLCVWRRGLQWKESFIRKLKKDAGCEQRPRFIDRPCVTLNQRQPGPHARNSRSNSPAWWRWTRPWLGWATHTHTHSLPSLLFTEAYHIAKLEKPRQNMAYRLQVPLGLVQPVTGVNLCSLTSPPLLLSRLLSRGPICLLGDQIAAFFLTTTKKKKKASTL